MADEPAAPTPVVEIYTDEPEGDHTWHFRYNRRLSCFSHAVSSLAFSIDGRYLVSGTGSGDVKIWDTGCWGEAGKLRGCRREEPKSIVISPAQRWLVAAYPSVIHIFNCAPPWRLEQSLPALLDMVTKEPSEWACIAFSPMAEVDHPAGQAGQDNHLAAFSNSHLCVIDYAGGWGDDVPRRTRSLMQSGRPTMLVYTHCGAWMICGFESGQLQIWNTASLTLSKTLNAHSEAVNGVAASPRAAAYDSRFVSCGVDQTLRVWHTQGWLLEQHVHDTHCDRGGILRCTFSATGSWLLSVANELCVWRVVITQRGRFILTLHQRLAAVCGAEGLRTAAFGKYDAIAVGSRDGVLGLWTKCPGAPPDPAETAPENCEETNSHQLLARTDSMADCRPGRPLQRVTQGGIRPVPQMRMRTEWFHLASVRPAPLASQHRAVLAGAANTAASATAKLVCSSPPGAQASRLSCTTGSMPDLMGWKAAQNRELPFVSYKTDRPEASTVVAKNWPSENEYIVEGASATRKSMQHACKGLVQRIRLDPKVI